MTDFWLGVFHGVVAIVFWEVAFRRVLVAMGYLR